MFLKLGKLAAQRPYGIANLAAYANGRLPAPPAAAHYGHLVTAPWGMLGNDQYGDCVMAGIAHDILLGNFDEGGATLPVPNAAAVVEEYFNLTGGQDTGLVISSTLQTWRTSGLFGTRIAAYAPVNHADIIEIHQAIAFYGGLLVGFQLPQSAQQQFPGEWTVVPGSPIEGGHCVLLTGYDQEAVYGVTWGRIVAISYPFLSTYLDEGYAIITEQAAQRGAGPTGLNVAQLQADLAQLNGTSAPTLAVA